MTDYINDAGTDPLRLRWKLRNPVSVRSDEEIIAHGEVSDIRNRLPIVVRAETSGAGWIRELCTCFAKMALVGPCSSAPGISARIGIHDSPG